MGRQEQFLALPACKEDHMTICAEPFAINKNYKATTKEAVLKFKLKKLQEKIKKLNNWNRHLQMQMDFLQLMRLPYT